jgi:hypothetical protein
VAEPTFRCLSVVATTLYQADIDEPHLLELLRHGTLGAVIKYPSSVHPYRIPEHVWVEMPDEDFVVSRYPRIDGIRQRRPRPLEIDIEFAVEATVQQIKQLIRRAIAHDLTLFDEPGIEVHLPVKIRSKAPDAVCWDSVQSTLVNLLVGTAEEPRDTKRVYVLSADFQDFKKSHKIREKTSSGAPRLPYKDQIWVEILNRYFMLVPRAQKTTKERVFEIIAWVEATYGNKIGQQTIEDVLSTIDQVAEGHLQIDHNLRKAYAFVCGEVEKL